jgi:hypothetical protein
VLVALVGGLLTFVAWIPAGGRGVESALLFAIYRRLMDAVDPDIVDIAAASLRSVAGVHNVEDLRLR